MSKLARPAQQVEIVRDRMTVREGNVTKHFWFEPGTMRLHWRVETTVPGSLFAANHERGTRTGRAPLGDSHGAWQKTAELPMALLLDRLPMDAWGDDKALARVVNDRDLSKFRCDGGRRF